MTTDAFAADAWKRSNKRDRVWYQENLLNVLNSAKEKQARGVEGSITLAKELLRIYEEPLEKPVEVPLRDLAQYKDDSLMTPIEPKVLDLLYLSTEKGSTEKYLKARNKKAPEDKFFFRIATSWDYGWQQKQSRLRGSDVHKGRCAILRDTFYRKNNLAPDPPCYAQPSGGEVSICSEYSCYFN